MTSTWTPPAPTDTTVKLRVKGQWPFLNRVNDMSKKYQIDLNEISEDGAKQLADMGIKVKTKDDQPEKGYYIVPTSKNPIKVFMDGKELTDVQIGNGTEFIATIGTYEWNNTYGKGISPTIRRLEVTKLVEFVPDADDDAPIF